MISDDAEEIAKIIASRFPNTRERAGVIGAAFRLLGDIDGTNGISYRVARQLLFSEPPAVATGQIMLPLDAIDDVIKLITARYKPYNYFGLLLIVAHILRKMSDSTAEYDSVLYTMLGTVKLYNIDAN